MQPNRARFVLAAAPQRVALVLTDADGRPWRLAMSAGMERFIGPYPRLAAIEPDGPWLRFEAVQPTS